MSKTKIQWTEHTINPIVGCSKISEGCKNCYAERMACRLANMGQKKYQAVVKPKQNHSRSYKPKWAGKWNGKIYFDESCLQIPLKRKKPTMFFVSSMGDIFHKTAKFKWVDAIVDVARKCPQHKLQLLTKRAERMYEYSKRIDFEWPENIIGMVTTENQEMADLRIPYLLQCRFATTAISIEPCLGAISLDRPLCICKHWDSADSRNEPPWHPKDRTKIQYKKQSLRSVDYQTLDWVIVGGESGPGARYCELSNIHNIVDQCKKAGVKCFVKQIHGPLHQGKKFKLIKDINQFPEDLRIREYPNE